MYPQYSQYSHPQYNNNYSKINKHDLRIQQLQSDNKQLSVALQQLNQCYTEKIKILQQQLESQKQRTSELLTERRQYIDKCLFCNQKYEEQINKLINTIDELNLNFQSEKQKIEKQISKKNTEFQQQEQEIMHLRDQNSYLRNQRDIQQQRIQELVKTYIEQIQKLKSQLKELKQEESNHVEIQLQSLKQSLQNKNEEILKEISLHQVNITNLPCQMKSELSKNSKITISSSQNSQVFSQNCV